jgi:hypothetical protein
LSRVITGGESWIYGYDPNIKQQSSHWKISNSPRERKVRQLTIKGTIHKEFVLAGKTVHSTYYCEVLL